MAEASKRPKKTPEVVRRRKKRRKSSQARDWAGVFLWEESYIVLYSVDGMGAILSFYKSTHRKNDIETTLEKLQNAASNFDRTLA